MYDIIIIGGGPAGLTAALYARRANKTVLVIEKASFGGQITYSPKVENIPGFISVSGNEFGEVLMEQAMELGAEVECLEALSVTDGEIKTVTSAVQSGGDRDSRVLLFGGENRSRLFALREISDGSYAMSLSSAFAQVYSSIFSA